MESTAMPKGESNQVDEVVKTIAQFNVPGWTDLTNDQVTVSPLGDGYLNVTLKVERINYDEKQSKGPKCLVYKKYGGNVLSEKVKSFGLNSALIQSLIFYEQSKHGWGPKLYGLFDEGRIEEFVEGHTLTAEEAFKPHMITHVARAFARFHSHKLPLSQAPRDLLAMGINFADAMMASVREWMNSGEVDAAELAKYPIEDIINFPFKAEYEWANAIRNKIRQRVVLITLDTNYLNRLVRRETTDDTNDSKVLIIDHDVSCYSYRGYELAGHFINRIFDLSRDDTMCSGLPFPSKEERTAFLTAYLDECCELFDDFDPESLDSLENLTLEVDINSILNTLAVLIFSTEWIKMAKVKPKMPTVSQPLLQLYKQVKEYFIAEHPSLLE